MEQLSGNLSDSCPTAYGTSTKNNTLGCSDVDGWADFDDKFPEDSSQWADTDNDGLVINSMGLRVTSAQMM